MVKHFEELWEESESVSSKAKIKDLQNQLHSEIDNLFIETSIDDKSRIFGKILFFLCNLSFKWNINTFAALLKETQDHKIDFIENQ